MNIADNPISLVFICITLPAFILLLRIVLRKWREYKSIDKFSKSGIRDIDRMDGFQFEVYLKALYKKLGYAPSVTQKTGDYGADLILKGKNKIVIQAKRYQYKNKVSLGAIQEIFTAKTFYNASEAWVVTNSTFTKKAQILAKACNVKLVNRYELVKLINQINPDIKPIDIIRSVQPKDRNCPYCKEKMVLRTSTKTGSRFFGCSNYPNCNHTEAINL